MTTLAEFWPQCLTLLASELTPQQFAADIEPLSAGEEAGVWVLYAKNQFAANLLRSRYADALARAKDLLAPEAPDILFKAGSGGKRYAAAPLPDTGQAETAAEGSLKSRDTGAAAPTPPPETGSVAKTPPKKPSEMTAQDILAERLKNLRPPKPSDGTAPNSRPAGGGSLKNSRPDTQHERTNLSPDYTFETLVEGKGNQLAATVARSIAEKPGDKMYNPFFVYGSTGLGKTHLVQAAGNELLRLNPKARVRYLTANDYLKSFMDTVRNKTWDTFKQQYLNYQLLIIDDIQFIQGKDRTMEEFFLLFEHFHSRNQQIILTCDQLPSSLENMEKRLVSRFSWGMTIRIEPPELEMRVDILEHKARAAGIGLTEDAAVFIAQNIKSSVRELEGTLNRVIARCRFEKKHTIDMDLAADTLQDIIAHNYKPITLELIMKAVADYHRIRIADLMGKKRTRNIARPRQMAMAIAKELTSLSLPAIGDAFGGRDHTTVMHAVKKIAELRDQDPELKQDYDKLLILIKN